MSEEREKIMERRSSLRSWRERRGRMPHRREFIGATILVMIFLSFISYSFWSGAQNNSAQPSEKQNKTPASASGKKVSPSGSIPAPGIMLYSPGNTTYNTSTPPLNFAVSGSKMDRVLLSVDGGTRVSVPHDGITVKIDFAKINPLFIEDFGGATKGRWAEKGNWRVEGGKYITKNGSSSFGDPAWDDYIIEAKIKITSGENVSMDIRWDGGSKYYSVQMGNKYGSLLLNRVDSKGYTNLFSSKLPGINPADWHIWKIAVSGSKIQGFIDDVKYIDYTDGKGAYLKGNPRLRVLNATVEYDHVSVYKPLPPGQHSIAIFANNTAGNTSSRVVYFTIGTNPANQDKAEKIGAPLIKNGFEITVKSVTVGEIQTSVWVIAKNLGNMEKPFKLNPDPVIIDNIGNQYERIKVARSAEIAQSDLYPKAKREGAIFFEKFKEGAKPKRLVMYVNGDRFEFMLDNS